MSKRSVGLVVAGFVVLAVAVFAGSQLLTGDADTLAIAATDAETTDPQDVGTDGDDPGTAPVEVEPDEGHAEEPDDAPAEESGDPDLTELFTYDPATVEDAPPPSSPAELIGGPADRVAAAVLHQDLGQAGHDLTGLGIDVLPVAGTDGSLLVLSMTDATALVANGSGGGDTAVAEQLLADTLGTIEARQLAVTQLVFNYSGVDDTGPLTFTATFSVDDLKAVFAGNKEAEDVFKVQVVRGGGGA